MPPHQPATTSLNAGTFLHATPQLIFNFSDLAPGASLTVPYDPVTPAGIYQILWDQNAPAGFVNSGTFDLGAQWWSGDPAHGGALIGTAPPANQPYSVSLTPVPEPTSVSGHFYRIRFESRLRFTSQEEFS